jgi:DNA-binding NarL/FixJ family response regulator
MIPAAVHADAENARRCLRGELLAEELTTTARELVIAALHKRGLPDAQIARRTGLSTYTAARIRARLCLPAHPLSGGLNCGA